MAGSRKGGRDGGRERGREEKRGGEAAGKRNGGIQSGSRVTGSWASVGEVSPHPARHIRTRTQNATLTSRGGAGEREGERVCKQMDVPACE